MKKGVFTMFFFFCLVTVGSVVTLSGCTDCFGEPDAPDLKVDSMNGHLVYLSNIQEYNGNDYYQVEDFTNIVAIGRYDSIGLLISINSVIAQIENQKLINNIFNSAYACDRIPFNISKIKNIEINSNENYNSNYKTGISLNDLFVISVYYATSTISISNYLSNHYLDNNMNLLIVPIEAPEFDSTHSFTIEITLEDGRVFNMELPPVTIKI